MRPAGLLLGLAGAVVVALLLGPVYGLVGHVPFVNWMTFLAAIIFGAAVGKATAWMMVRLKVRNVPAVVGAALIAQAIGQYAAWAFWFHMAFRRGPAIPNAPAFDDLLLSPALLWQCVVGTAESVSILRIGMWIAEAALIAWAAATFARRLAAAESFCETCDTWEARERAAAVLATCSELNLRKKLEGGDLGALAAIGLPKAGSRVRLECDLHVCPRCGETHALSIRRAMGPLSSFEWLLPSEKIVIDRLPIGPTEAAIVRALPKPGAAAPAAKPAVRKKPLPRAKRPLD
jgi:hypothetical protein